MKRSKPKVIEKVGGYIAHTKNKLLEEFTNEQTRRIGKFKEALSENVIKG